MNKPVYLGLLMLELSKILMYQFWYKPNYGAKARLSYINIDTLIVYIKTDDT